MKLRREGDSIRVRLDRRDPEPLAASGRVADAVHFGPGVAFPDAVESGTPPRAARPSSGPGSPSQSTTYGRPAGERPLSFPDDRDAVRYDDRWHDVEGRWTRGEGNELGKFGTGAP